MRNSDIAGLFRETGPFASISLATSHDEPDAARQLALRWKDARRELAGAGAPASMLQAIEPAVDGAHTRGATLAAIAGPGGLLLAEALPEPPMADHVARFGPLPDVVELLRQSRDEDLVWVAARIDRGGAGVAVLGGDAKPLAVQEIEGERGPNIRKSKPGGWSQRRYQNRAEHFWQANAKEVAERLTGLVDELAPRLVAVAGDVRAVQLLREAVPERVAGLLREVGGELADLDEVIQAGTAAAEELVRADLDALLTRFAEQRGQRDRAVDGVEGTVGALAEARVQTLLLDPAQVAERTAWFGPEPFHLALERDTLRAVGVGEPAEGRLTDVLLRAVFGGGGEACLIGADERAPAGGVGALVRWPVP